MNKLEITFSSDDAYKILDLCVNHSPSKILWDLPNDLIKMLFENAICESDLEAAKVLAYASPSARKFCLSHSKKYFKVHAKYSQLYPNEPAAVISNKVHKILNLSLYLPIAKIILENDLKDLVWELFQDDEEFCKQIPFKFSANQIELLFNNPKDSLPGLMNCILSPYKTLDILVGHLPLSIGLFANLEKLLIQNGSLKGLPQTIGQLSQLENLDASGNEIEKIPAEICNLKKLKELFLHKNRLSELPERIGDLNLKVLTIRHNKIKKLPYSVKKLINQGCCFDHPYSNYSVLKLMPDNYSKIKVKLMDNGENIIKSIRIFAYGILAFCIYQKFLYVKENYF